MTEASAIDVVLDRDLFLRRLIRELAGTLQEVVGLDEASGYISVVGREIGDWINNEYRSKLGVSRLTREQVGEVLVGLKRRIEGDFSIVEQSDSKIVLHNTRCPFGDAVIDRSCMCMMTSNVFGVVTADNLGYAKVELEETIAKRDGHCRVVIHLRRTAEAEQSEGREYFGVDG